METLSEYVERRLNEINDRRGTLGRSPEEMASALEREYAESYLREQKLGDVLETFIRLEIEKYNSESESEMLKRDIKYLKWEIDKREEKYLEKEN